LLCAFAAARFALSIKPPAAGDSASSAVAVVREYIDALIVAGLIALLLVTFVIRPFYIPSVSMVPTLAVRDIVLVDQLGYRFSGPKDGDVAVFTPPIESHGSEFIKRVIGVPGDRIRISNGIVYRNGVALREPYENEPPKYDLAIEHYRIVVDGTPLNPADADVPPPSMWQAPDRIPDGFYFMLGDNRNYSEDSHVWGFAQAAGRFVAGPLAGRASARAGFAGRAFLVFWPLKRFTIVT
jgi:signal peptidase I